MIDKLISAAKDPTNEAVAHWVDRFGLSGVLSVIAIKVGEFFSFITSPSSTIDWAGIVAIIVMLPLGANRIMHYRIQRVEEKIKLQQYRLNEIEIEKAEAEQFKDGME